MTADTTWALRWFAHANTVIAANRDHLTELDRLIGDADHGENLARGMQALHEVLEGGSFATPGSVFKQAAMTLMSSVGGSYGPLMGTALLRMSTTASDAPALDAPLMAACLEAALGGIVMRGKAEVGDKTMVDAWTPGVQAARLAADQGGSVHDVLAAWVLAGEQGRDSTVPLIARKGRASYLGERSQGHVDPGCVSSVLIMQAALDALNDA